MAMLGLIHHQEGTRFHDARPEYRAHLPLAAFAYAVAELFEQTKQQSLPIGKLLHSDGFLAVPGSVFRITEECLVAKLEAMIAWLSGTYELRESAGIHQIYRIGSITPLKVLERHYAQSVKGSVT
jgi:hypothetical protein